MSLELPSRFSRGFPIRLPQSRSGQIALALGVVYVVWGSTYLAVHVALGSFQPILMSGLRNLFAGVGLFFFAARLNPVWPGAAGGRGAGRGGAGRGGGAGGRLA